MATLITKSERRKIIYDTLCVDGWGGKIDNPVVFTFLNLFPKYQKAIRENRNVMDLYIKDRGDLDGEFCITRQYYCPVRNALKFEPISDMVMVEVIYAKLMKLYPYTPEELVQNAIIEKERKAIERAESKERNALDRESKARWVLEHQNKVYTSESMAPGKYKDKTWVQVQEIDPNYVKWMISVTKYNNLKTYLESL